MRWSYSRLSTFRHCKYEFYLNYIIADDDVYLNEGNFYAENGSYVHEILEKIFKGILQTDEAAEYYLNHFDENVFYKTRQSIMDKKINASIDYLANVDFGWMDGYEILGVEKELKFKIGEHDMIAYVDLLLREKDTGKIIVIDHKSGAYPLTKTGKIAKNYEKTFDGYRHQAYIYAHGIYAEYNTFPTFFCWNHFTDGGRFVELPFSEDDYRETLNWVEETITEAENETEFPENRDFFYCTQLCGFRKSCEYAAEDWS